MNEIKLPKSDKRYKAGKIVKDKKGVYRGNPETVELKPMSLPPNAPMHIQLNPPLVASIELVRFLEVERLVDNTPRSSEHTRPKEVTRDRRKYDKLRRKNKKATPVNLNQESE